MSYLSKKYQSTFSMFQSFASRLALFNSSHKAAAGGFCTPFNARIALPGLLLYCYYYTAVGVF
jgi:hypothetical protein